MQQQRDQQAAEAAVAVEEGVDRLELHVGERGPDQRGGRLGGPRTGAGPAVQKGLEGRHAGLDFVGRRRHEVGAARSRATDPVLRAPELARQLLAAPRAGHQLGVHLADQAVAERESLAQAHHGVAESSHIVRDLDDVVDRHAGHFVELEEQQVRERRLGALDLGREHGLAPHVGVEEEIGVRQQLGDAVEAAEREGGPFEERLAGAIEIQRRCGGSGRGTKARTVSPPARVSWSVPVASRFIAGRFLRGQRSLNNGVSY